MYKLKYIVMRSLVITIASVVLVAISSCFTAAKGGQKGSEDLKPRIIVITDIAPATIEPDDMESLIRLLVHADMFEIEAIIASSGWNSGDYPISWMDSLRTTINAYEKDLPNLIKRSGQTSWLPIEKENEKQFIGYWPSAEYLRNRIAMGSVKSGIAALGQDNDSEGSALIIKIVDEADDRPVWVTVWGGANTLAQALWRVKQERSTEDLNKFLNKLRVYTITDQDMPYSERTNLAYSSHKWMRGEFEKELLFIWDESAWLSQNSIGSRNWSDYQKHIQGHGYLGSIYPDFKWGVEGDTPSFLHVMPNGLNNPNYPEQVGWGGYFVFSESKDKSTFCYTNFSEETKKISQKYENYFYPAIFNNFAARMDWAAYGEGNRNPIAIINGKKGLEMITVKAKSGKEVFLDGSKSYDPDGDSLTFKWWIQPEAGTYNGQLMIKDANSAKPSVMIPTDAAGKSIHVILEINDNGEPMLTSYRRIVINVN